MFEESRVLAIIFDISLQQKDIRLIDIVKKQVVSFLQNYDNGENLFYLYNPRLMDVMTDRGMFISSVGNYETDGQSANITNALKQSTFIISAYQGKRTLLVITDRLKDNNFYALEKIQNIIRTNSFDVEVLVVYVDQCDERVGDVCNFVKVEPNELGRFLTDRYAEC